MASNCSCAGQHSRSYLQQPWRHALTPMEVAGAPRCLGEYLGVADEEAQGEAVKRLTYAEACKLASGMKSVAALRSPAIKNDSAGDVRPLDLPLKEPVSKAHKLKHMVDIVTGLIGDVDYEALVACSKARKFAEIHSRWAPSRR